MNVLPAIIITVWHAFFIILGYWFGGSVEFDNQLGMLEKVLTFSSIVLAVVGLWLAVIFPEVISTIYGNTPIEEKKSSLISAQWLLYPLFICSFVSAAALILMSLMEVTKGVYFGLMPDVFLSLTFSAIMLLAGLSLFALFCALRPGVEILLSGWSFIDRASVRQQHLSRKK